MIEALRDFKEMVLFKLIGGKVKDEEMERSLLQESESVMLKLPNGKPIDHDMVEQAMEDSNREHSYYLNLQTGEVTCISAFDDFSNEREKLLGEIESSDIFVPIERIASDEAYQWMEDFVTQIVASKNERLAGKFFIALTGKGVFRRFKEVLHGVDDEWAQAWYSWRDDHLHEAMKEWFASLPLE